MHRFKHAFLILLILVLASPALPPRVCSTRELGASVERHIPSDEPLSRWARDPEQLETESGDKLEERDVVGEAADTVKLKNVVPPIHFESGVANIPPSYIDRLRVVLESMRHLDNVRLHMVGHADDQPLSSRLAEVYGDNVGLSRERAGEVAEFIQTALGLPPESISFSWAGDTEPLASNATPEGRARNRRVEVEVWYDEIRETVATEEVVVPEDIKRVKICRTETVCKLRYREGHEHRARVKNLVAPLQLADENVAVPEDFVQPGRRSPPQPARQTEPHREIHRIHGRPPAHGPCRANLRHAPGALEGARTSGCARDQGRTRAADGGDRERRPR